MTDFRRRCCCDHQGRPKSEGGFVSRSSSFISFVRPPVSKLLRVPPVPLCRNFRPPPRAKRFHFSVASVFLISPPVFPICCVRHWGRESEGKTTFSSIPLCTSDISSINNWKHACSHSIKTNCNRQCLKSVSFAVKHLCQCRKVNR